MIPMSLVGVRVEVPTNQPIVLLHENDGQRYLPIYIGSPEATAIVYALQGMETPRPMTHDLFKTVLDEIGFRLSGKSSPDSSGIAQKKESPVDPPGDSRRAVRPPNSELIQYELTKMNAQEFFAELRNLAFAPPLERLMLDGQLQPRLHRRRLYRPWRASVEARNTATTQGS